MTGTAEPAFDSGFLSDDFSAAVLGVESSGGVTPFGMTGTAEPAFDLGFLPNDFSATGFGFSDLLSGGFSSETSVSDSKASSSISGITARFILPKNDFSEFSFVS